MDRAYHRKRKLYLENCNRTASPPCVHQYRRNCQGTDHSMPRRPNSIVACRCYNRLLVGSVANPRSDGNLSRNKPRHNRRRYRTAIAYSRRYNNDCRCRNSVAPDRRQNSHWDNIQRQGWKRSFALRSHPSNRNRRNRKLHQDLRKRIHIGSNYRPRSRRWAEDYNLRLCNIAANPQNNLRVVR